MAAIIRIDNETRGAASSPTVLVMGMGSTGASCARYFAAQGIVAEFLDTRRNPPGVGAILDAMPDARVSAGEESALLRPTIDRIVVSPGFDLDMPILRDARERDIAIVSDIDLFVAECNAPIIAITGSNGKSTVTSMVGDMLSATGWTVAVGGNLGTPALDLLADDVEAYCLELSSFQLERSRPIPSAVSVLLNISPDHLDLHADMSAYQAAKSRIYLEARHAVVNRDFPDLDDFVPNGTPVTSFGLDEPTEGQIGVTKTSRGQCIAHGDKLLLSVDEIPVYGRHNLANALAAIALGSVLGANLNGMAQALRRFKALPHRMEVVETTDQIRWINDSKATNTGAAIASLESIDDPFVLLAGGDAKGATFESLANALRGRKGRVILFGCDAPAMAAELEPAIKVETSPSLKAAVEAAARDAAPGTTILLAPACSSLDMFEDFAARGRAFCAAVHEVTA